MTAWAWLFVGSASAVILGLIFWPLREKTPQELLDEVNKERRNG